MKISKFTFAILAYNQANIIGETLESIKYQIEKYGDNRIFKIIVTDDFSNIAFAQRVIGASPREIKKNVARVLSLVGLSEKYRSNPSELSGGEQQRVALARALVNKPQYILADEPTGNLDPENSWEIMKLLEKVNEQGTTVIVVTHNMEIVKAMNKRVITMKKGVKVEDSKGEEQTDEY